MALIDRMLRYDKCVYWKRTGTSAVSQPIVDDPEEVDCRWEDVTIEFVDSAGRTVTSRSRVFLGFVPTVGGYLWHGKLEDLEDVTLHPQKIKDAWEIKSSNQIPKMKNNKVLKWAML